MVIIYDFDGTLTPDAIPQYNIFKENGYDNNKLIVVAMDLVKNNNISLYEAFYKIYIDLFNSLKIEKNEENILKGSKDIIFNPGVISFFEHIVSRKEIKNYIVTSGIKNYVENSLISPFVDKVYGTEFCIEDGIYKKVSFLLDDKQKVRIIKDIRKNNLKEKIIYIGDGLTDLEAFKYVKSIGGISLLLSNSEDDLKNNNILEDYVDECFIKDFRLDSKLTNYITSVINNCRE